MKIYAVSVIVVLLSAVMGHCTGQEPPGRNADQQHSKVDHGSAVQQDKDCTNFKVYFGIGTSYFYTCCGELRVDNPPLGNEEMVENWDCNPSYMSYAHVNETQKYNCNGDAGKTAARAICNARWGWLAAETCWEWSACFAGACQRESNEPGSASLIDGFCGDGRCDGDEDTTSCPGDCCPQENPIDCQMKNNTCTDACCSESTCCFGSTLAFFSNFWVIVFSVIGGVFVLINICCCCCCYCAYKRCKGTSRKKSHPTTVDRQDTTMTVLSMK